MGPRPKAFDDKSRRNPLHTSSRRPVEARKAVHAVIGLLDNPIRKKKTEEHDPDSTTTTGFTGVWCSD